MTVSDLIEQLKKMPPDSKVYYEGGDYKDDWRNISKVTYGQKWADLGVFLE
jgi:hypothetical protein